MTSVTIKYDASKVDYEIMDELIRVAAERKEDGSGMELSSKTRDMEFNFEDYNEATEFVKKMYSRLKNIDITTVNRDTRWEGIHRDANSCTFVCTCCSNKGNIIHFDACSIFDEEPKYLECPKCDQKYLLNIDAHEGLVAIYHLLDFITI